MKPPILAIVGYSPESHCRNAQPGVGLDCRFWCFPSSVAGCATSSAAEERCLSPTSPGCIYHTPRMHNMPVSTVSTR